MMRLNYSGGSIMTTNAIADAVTDYSAALVRAETSVAADVPGIGVDGEQRDFRLRLGLGSQILTEPWGRDVHLDRERAFLASLRKATAKLPEPVPRSPDRGEHPGVSTPLR